MKTSPVQLIKNEAVGKLSDFELFWESYPRKKSKGDALKAWKQTESVRPAIEELLGAIESQLRTPQWQEAGGQFIPYPASWLRKWGWADED
jgi:hypothetical protein